MTENSLASYYASMAIVEGKLLEDDIERLEV